MNFAGQFWPPARLIFVAAGVAQKAMDYVFGETLSVPAPANEACTIAVLAA